MSSKCERIFVPSVHALQPQRRLFHRSFSDVKLDPQGVNWTDKAFDECYKPLALEQKVFEPEVNLSADFYGILRMQVGDRRVHKDILKGLRENGIGDSFIHPILPFLADDDKRILIGAGRYALEKENIKPLVFWAPESALDSKTLDILKDFDYKAVLLAPRQVRRADGGITDNYPLRLKNGLIAIPFDERLHNDVSFGDISNADHFTRRNILPRIDRSPLGFVIMHTDIETYGHHRKGGDRFLGYLIKDSIKEQGIEVTSLNKMFQKMEADKYHIPSGEFVENTSWSCPHGLDRWKRQCSCTPNGWWKEKFLRTFTWLNQEIKNTVNKEMSGSKEKLDTLVIENFEELLVNRGGSSSNKDKSLLSARVDGLSGLQSCSTFHNSADTAGRIGIGLGLEAIQHISDAGLQERSSKLLSEYLDRLKEINDPLSESPIQVAGKMMNDRMDKGRTVSFRGSITRC